MNTVMKIPSMIMTMKTSLIVICRNQKLIAIMKADNNKTDLCYSATTTEWCYRK